MDMNMRAVLMFFVGYVCRGMSWITIGNLWKKIL